MNLPDDLTDEALRRLAESALGEPAKPTMGWPIMWSGMLIGWSGSCYNIARKLARELLALRAAQENLVHVNAVRVVAEDAARLSAELAQARADLAAAQAAMTLDHLRAELHRLATSTSPEADRCADALAELVEPLAPPPDAVVRWLKGRGWRTDGVGAMWQTMRRGSRGLVDVPLLVGSRDYARCVAGLVGEVAIVEGVRRSRMAVDLWATTKESTHV